MQFSKVYLQVHDPVHIAAGIHRDQRVSLDDHRSLAGHAHAQEIVVEFLRGSSIQRHSFENEIAGRNTIGVSEYYAMKRAGKDGLALADFIDELFKTFSFFLMISMNRTSSATLTLSLWR